jgi:hypothetical protein
MELGPTCDWTGAKEKTEMQKAEKQTNFIETTPKIISVFDSRFGTEPERYADQSPETTETQR